MQYGCQKPTGPFVLSFTVHQEPRCPGCAEFLQPGVIEFHDNWAWCPVCVSMGLHTQPWIGAVLGDERMRECSSVYHGLRFYTPDLTNGEASTAYEQCEKLCAAAACSVVLGTADDYYQVADDGHDALARMGKSAPMRTEADMRRDGTLPPL